MFPLGDNKADVHGIGKSGILFRLNMNSNVLIMEGNRLPYKDVGKLRVCCGLLPTSRLRGSNDSFSRAQACPEDVYPVTFAASSS